MSAGIATVGRKQYASGLYWENSPSGSISQAAKEAARQPGHQAQYYAVRTGNKAGRVPQFGLSQEQSGHNSGMPSLAACLANQQPGSWAGAFRLREGTAVVVVRDDLIVPDGDLFFLDETEARDRIYHEMALGGLQRVYAPETWGVSGADTMPLGLLLNERADVRLKSVSLSKGGAILLLLGFSFLIILLAGGWYYQQMLAQEEAERQASLAAAERIKQQAQQAMNLVVAPKPVYPPPDRKWEKRPKMMQVVDSCKTALSQLSMVYVGWRMDGIRCDETSLTQKWSRSSGFTTPPPKAIINDTGGSATITISLPTLNPRGDESLSDPDEITKRYLTQNWPGTIRRIADDPPPPPPPDYKGEWNPPPAPWIKRSFTVTAPLLPWILPVFFEDLPGIIVTSLAFTPSGTGGSWLVDGVIYENRR